MAKKDNAVWLVNSSTPMQGDSVTLESIDIALFYRSA
jgi:hypothetical protein